MNWDISNIHNYLCPHNEGTDDNEARVHHFRPNTFGIFCRPRLSEVGLKKHFWKNFHALMLYRLETDCVHVHLHENCPPRQEGWFTVSKHAHCASEIAFSWPCLENDIKEIIVFCVINHYENWTLFVRQISNSKETCFQFCLRSWCPVIPQPVQVVPLPSIMLRPTQQSLAWLEFQNLQSFVRFWVVWYFLVHVVGRVIAQPVHPTHRQNLLHFVFGPLSKVL